MPGWRSIEMLTAASCALREGGTVAMWQAVQDYVAEARLLGLGEE